MNFADPDILHREIVAGFDNQKPAMDVFNIIIESYSAQAFTTAKGTRAPENRTHEYVSLMTPKLAANDPRVNVTTGLGDKGQPTATAISAGLNRWIMDTRHGRFLQRIAPYYLTGWCMTLTTLEKITGGSDTEDDVTSPVGIIIDPRDCTWDPFASAWETKRWCSHKYARDKDEALERADAKEGWIRSALEKCAEDSGLDLLSRSKSVIGTIPKRNEIVLYDVWVAPESDDPEDSGSLYTMAVNRAGTGEFVRKVRKFYGPRTGPYTLWGAYSVPGRSQPMSPMMAAWGQIEELNRHAIAFSRSAAHGKSIGIGDLPKAVMDAIMNARDGDNVNIPGYVKGGFEVVEYGYITKERIEALAVLSKRVNRVLGMDETYRAGAAEPNVTATASTIANTSSNDRVGFLAERFQECDEAFLTVVAWYLYHEKTVAIPLKISDEERRKFKVEKAVYRGGPTEGQKFEDFSLEIERYSMTRTSESVNQQRALEVMTWMMQVAPIIPQISPYWDVQGTLDMVGDWLNIPELSKLVNPDQAAAVRNQQVQMEQQAQQGPDGGASVAEQPQGMPGNASGQQAVETQAA